MKVTIEIESEDMGDLVRGVERAARLLKNARPERPFERDLRNVREAIGYLRFEPEPREEHDAYNRYDEV